MTRWLAIFRGGAAPVSADAPGCANSANSANRSPLECGFDGSSTLALSIGTNGTNGTGPGIRIDGPPAPAAVQEPHSRELRSVPNPEIGRIIRHAELAAQPDETAFEERAAIAEHDGGLLRDQAERQARQDCALSGPDGDDRADWRAWIGAWAEHHGREWVWSLAESAWHGRHGQRVDPAICPGCGMPIGQRRLLEMGDGARVHLDDRSGLDCLIQYGARWRGAAAAGLIEIGLPRPKGWTP